ncbi:hypothetical protein ACYX34_05920 [Nitrospira sp. CMX1]
MYGVGQGLNEGVRMAGSFLSDAMKMKQQQQRFDATMEQRDRHHNDSMERHYDRLALEQAWSDRFTTPEGMDSAPRLALPPDAFPRALSPATTPQIGQAPTPHMPSPTASTPAQPTIRPMQMTPAQFLLPAPKIVAKPAREFMPSTLSGNRSRWPR